MMSPSPAKARITRAAVEPVTGVKYLGRAAVAATVAVFAALNALHRLWFEPATAGLKSPDARFFGYDLPEFQAWQRAMADGGLIDPFVRWHTCGLDFVFPALLAVTLALLLRAVLNTYPRFRRMARAGRLAVVAVIVLPYAMFDYAENAEVAALLTGSIALDAGSVGLASTLTVLKWLSVALAFLVLIVFYLHARLTGQKPEQTP
jgi:hypothetical protein